MTLEARLNKIITEKNIETSVCKAGRHFRKLPLYTYKQQPSGHFFMGILGLC